MNKRVNHLRSLVKNLRLRLYDSEGARQILANEVVAQAAIIEKLRSEAATDPLTGLANRRAFDERFKGEMSLLARGIPHPLEDTGERRQPPDVSFMVVDIDHFKSINDNYGHPAGDTVLVELARRMREHFLHRPSDIVARCGGEEFWVFWPMVSGDIALEKASDFCRKVAAQSFNIPDGHGGTREIQVTLSIGLATIEVIERLQADEAFLWLNNGADEALYWVKENGRNQALHIDQLPGVTP